MTLIGPRVFASWFKDLLRAYLTVRINTVGRFVRQFNKADKFYDSVFVFLSTELLWKRRFIYDKRIRFP